MNKFYKLLFSAALILCSCFFAGCIKDSCHHTYTYSYFIPVYKTTDQVRDNIKSSAPVEIQNAGKISVLGKYIFLNEMDKGIHVIDNSNPAAPVNVAFINIPGNMDIAVKGNILYADAYTDLITLDITNPLNVVVKKYNDGVFPDRLYSNGFNPDGNKVIVDWIKRDTTLTEECSTGNIALQSSGVLYMSTPTAMSGTRKSSSPVGLGGSTARFALINNYLYTVDFSDLSIFNISRPADPVFANKVAVDLHIETVYPFKDKLFIGSNLGVYIYNVEPSPAQPVRIGEFAHARVCDPVIADDNYAYVSLHSDIECLGFNNELDVVKLNSLVNATLAKTYSFTSPRGLSKDGKVLFICDGAAGLKVYDATDPLDLKSIKEFADLETSDVIAYNNIAIVVATDGLYQYDYSSVNNIHLVSKIAITK